MQIIKKSIIVLCLISIGESYCADQNHAKYDAAVQRAKKEYQKKMKRYLRMVRNGSPNEDEYFKTVFKPSQQALIDAKIAPIRKAADKRIALIQEKMNADEKSCCSRLFCCFSRKK